MNYMYINGRRSDKELIVKFECELTHICIAIATNRLWKKNNKQKIYQNFIIVNYAEFFSICFA